MSVTRIDSKDESIMSAEDAYELAWTRLQHVLSFFERVDTKQSVVLGIDVALLGVLATQFVAIKDVSVFGWVLVGAFLPLNFLSFVFLYRGSFPRLEGGAGSLIYFAQIAKRTRDEFAAEFRAQNAEGRLEDVLEQLRHNACIATDKYRHLCWAYRFMALSLLPWCVALATFAIAVDQ